MNTLPDFPPVVYLAGRYMTSLDMLMAGVRDVLSSSHRNALMEQEHLLALYRDGVLLDWLRALTPVDHRAEAIHSSMEKLMQQTLTDTEAKKALGNLFGAKEACVTALRFDEYLELLPECKVKKDDKSYVQNINEEIDVDNMEGNHIVIGLSFRVKKAANDVISVSLGETIKNIPLHTKGKIYTIEFRIIISDKKEVHLKQIGDRKRIHSFSLDYEWVDLGFGVKWGKCNVGAKYPWELGAFFVWGATNEAEEDGVALRIDISGNEYYDCATSIKGDRWKIPTTTAFKQLFEMCDKVECDIQGIRCYRLTSRINKKSIIIPKNEYSGEYAELWTSVPKDLTYAYSVNLRNSIYLFPYDKDIPLPVRPIYVG